MLNYEPQSEWLNQINNTNNTENTIDYFFTQRKVNEVEEYIDEKTLERKKKKICHIYNFLAINFPLYYFKSYHTLIIDVEIWGDMMFHYKGTYDRGSEMACLPLATGAEAEDRHLVLRSARPLATWQQRKHQRPASSVHAQGHRSERRQPDLAQ